MKSSENGAFSCVESNELFPSALSAAEMIEAQYTCRLFKKVKKDRKCREEEEEEEGFRLLFEKWHRSNDG